LLFPRFCFAPRLVSVDQPTLKEINSLLYDFVWNGKDKVKRHALISDFEKGGLKMPDVESAITSQRVMCIKKYVEEPHRSWKTILDHHLNSVGGAFLFKCNYDPNKLSLRLPRFYEECIKAWFRLNKYEPNTIEEISNEIIWNNRFICIDKYSVFYRNIWSQGIYKIGDLYDQHGTLNLLLLNRLSSTERLALNGVLHSFPHEWRLKIKENRATILSLTKPLSQLFFLRLKGKQYSLLNITSKQVYSSFIDNLIIPPSAKTKYENKFKTDLDWPDIYTLPAKCCLDTKTREFQFKVLHRIVYTKKLLYKIGKSDSPLCSFCGSHEETLEHLLVECEKVDVFWKLLAEWLAAYNVILEYLNEVDIILGVCKLGDDKVLINHILLLAKYFIYKCSLKKMIPTVSLFVPRIRYTYDIEFRIATNKDKLPYHYKKWNKLLLFIYNKT